MEEWRFIDLGPQDMYTIHSVYEAIARYVGKGVVPNTVEFCYPAYPYVCIGVHQILDLEVDVDYCFKNGIPFIRRQVGGGAVYLDSGQQFYHVVVGEDHELARRPVDKFYEAILRSVVKFYRSYGLNASYKPINDVVIDGRKASGNGAAKIHGSMVLIGNVILNFNVEAMARILRVPSEKFRDKLISNMREWVTSLRRELGYIPDRREVKERLRECFERALGVRLVDSELTREELNYMEKLREKYSSPKWLHMKTLPRRELLESRKVKIREGHYIVQVDYKGLKLVRILAEVVDDRIEDIILSGDFFVEPYQALDELEEALKGCRLEERDVREALEGFEGKAEIHGFTIMDLVEALMKVKERLTTL